jgi:RNA polymerase sigma factor (sigma-70 family)
LGDNGHVVSIKDMTAQELLAEFHRTGQEAPYAEIVRRYAGMVYHVCLQVTKDVHDAEDATQAVFLTLAVRGKTAQEIKYLAPWLQRVGHRLSLDIRRSKKRRSARENKHHEMNRTRLGDGNNTGQVDLDETKRILRDELDKLPSKYRLPLILHYFGGLKPDEMARELGCKTSTLGVRLHRGRKLLADSMKGRGITLSGGMLSAAMLSLVQHGIEDTILQHTTTHAGGRIAAAMAGHQLVATSIPLHVLAITRAAAKAVGFAKAKIIIALVLLVATLAGAREVVNKIQPFGIHIDFKLTDIIRPLMRNFLRPLQFTEATPEKKDLPAETPKAPEAVVEVKPAPKPVLATPAPAVVQVAVVEPPKVESEVSSAADEMPSETTLTRLAPLRTSVQAHGLPSAHTMFTPIVPRQSTEVATAPAQSYAAGTFRQVAGVQQYATLRLDSLSSLQAYEMAGGQLYANNAIVGDRGNGSFKQTGGDVKVTRDVTLGNQHGSSGQYAMSGKSTLSAAQLNVGKAGHGSFEQFEGNTHIKEKVTIADADDSTGSVKVHGGTFIAGSADVAKSGKGEFVQDGGNVFIDNEKAGSGDGKLTIAVDSTSKGGFTLSSGTFEAKGISVGHHGKGSYDQAGGQTATHSINVGESTSGSGVASLKSGDVFIDMRTSPSGTLLSNSETATGLIVGDRGDAQLVLGGVTNSPVITERPAFSGASLVVRAQPDSEGVVRGWGAPKLTGSFIQNGKVVADGFGSNRDLDLSTLKGVLNTIENAPTGDNGWYACRGGRLILPPIQVNGAGAYNWGESPDDKSPDLVNSVRLSLHDVAHRGTAQLTLLTPNDPSIPGLPHGEKFLGVWSFEGHGLKFDSADLWIRYDDALAQNLDIDPSTLKIWTFNESWKLGGLIDLLPDQRLIGATATDFQYFAVAGSDHAIAAPSAEFINITPEPGSISLLLMGAGALLVGRPRRKLRRKRVL